MALSINWSEFDRILSEGSRSELDSFLSDNQLYIKDDKIYARDNNEVDLSIEYWDKAQLIQKILLNSAYGGLLNQGSRFSDKRIGQSTTLSGRQVDKHMAAKVNEIITGVYDHVGDAAIYCDTDSVYFSAYNTLKPMIDSGELIWNKDTVIALYDSIGEAVNDTFSDFMEKQFHCPPENGAIIKAGREIVATKGLFITKKRYAAMVYDKDGKRKDRDGKPGEIKAMGLDLKRSDTPKFIQAFLSKILSMILDGESERTVLDYVTGFRKDFKNMAGWEKGSPKRANKISAYRLKEQESGSCTMPGHVRASLNWNVLCDINDDKYTTRITDGAKVIVCKLKNNVMEMSSIAYPVDEHRLPDWFKNLPFDDDGMEEVLIDKKLENLLGVLNFDLKSTQVKNMFHQFFKFKDHNV